MKKSLLSIALVGALFSGVASAEYLDFVVNENSVPGVSGVQTFTADLVNGRYQEKFAIYQCGTGLCFATNAVVDWNAFYANEGNDNPFGIGSLTNTQLEEGAYDMYATFSAQGTVTADSGGNAIFHATGGTFDLFIDPNNNSGFLGGVDLTNINFSGVNLDEDYKIATSTNLTFLQNTVITSGNNTTGAFDLIFDDFTLIDPEGTSFFIQPKEFWIRAFVDGDFDDFPAQAGIFRAGGDISATFGVPEPSTLALLGLGLTGLGLSLRRRKTA